MQTSTNPPNAHDLDVIIREIAKTCKLNYNLCSVAIREYLNRIKPTPEAKNPEAKPPITVQSVIDKINAIPIPGPIPTAKVVPTPKVVQSFTVDPNTKKQPITTTEPTTVIKQTKSDQIKALVDEGKTAGEISKILKSNYSYVWSVVDRYKAVKNRDTTNNPKE